MLSLLVVYHDIIRRNRKRAVYLRFTHVQRENINVTFASPSILAHLQRCDDVNEVYAKSASMSSMRSQYAEDNVVVIVDLPEKSVVDPSPAPFARIPIDLLDVTSNSSETRLTDCITRARRAYQKRKRLQAPIMETCQMFCLVQLGIFYVDSYILLTALKCSIALLVRGLSSKTLIDCA